MGNSDTSVPITANTQLPDDDLTQVFVQGDALSAGKAQEQITLSYVGGPGQAAIVIDKADYTVYSIEGSQNVPGDAVYQYTASVPGGYTPTGNTTWAVAGANGAIHSESANGLSANILWGNVPAVGSVFFTPAIGFRGERDLNVVQITFSANGNDAQYVSNPTQIQGAGGTLIKANGAGANEITAEITVSNI